jgi:sarcosine oxidase
VPPAEADHLVVGAGLLGLATARALARRGRSVVVVERAMVGHERSGSKGTARIFRLGHPEPHYVAMAQAAGRLWRLLEDETGLPVLRTTGQVTFGPGLHSLEAALSGAGAPFERLAAGSASERWPGLSVPGPALFEPESGVLAADRCLTALRTGPFELLESTAVTRLADDGRAVRAALRPSGADASARGPVPDVVVSSAVVCAGASSGPLLAAAGFDLTPAPTLEQVAYLAPTGDAPEPPVFVEWGSPAVYGLPEPDGERFKIAFHRGGPPADPATAVFEPDPALVVRLSEAARRILPGHDPRPVATERCLYDNSADTHFVLDRLGRVVVGAGTSGHGFKFGPLLGELLADLASGAAPSFDLGPFSAWRPGLAGPGAR